MPPAGQRPTQFNRRWPWPTVLDALLILYTDAVSAQLGPAHVVTRAVEAAFTPRNGPRTRSPGSAQ